MDKNSRKDETSKSVEDVVDERKPKEVDSLFELEDLKVKTRLEGQKSMYQVSGRCGSSYDASGASTSSPLLYENRETPLIPVKDVDKTSETNAEDVREPEQLPASDEDGANRPSSCVPPTYEAPPDSHPRVRMASSVEDQLTSKKACIGPPPSYSFVMKQKKKFKLPPPDPLIVNRPPPPTYAGNRGLYVDDETRLERICTLPSFGEPMWRSHSQPAFCNRCGVLVLTTTHSHDSVATHMAALALCLFGCWPCCLLPYCLSVCKNTYHHCPLCQAFLGVYSPW